MYHLHGVMFHHLEVTAALQGSLTLCLYLLHVLLPCSSLLHVCLQAPESSPPDVCQQLQQPVQPVLVDIENYYFEARAKEEEEERTFETTSQTSSGTVSSCRSCMTTTGLCLCR